MTVSQRASGAGCDTKRPLVSAIIIFLNGERFIREAIESVFAQTYQNWELLLVDDGSTDHSTEMARAYAEQHPWKVTYLDHPGHQNFGMSAARNLGIKAAKGKFIAFLDCDDVWLPGKLAEQVAVLEAQPEASMVYGRVRVWYSWTGKPEDLENDSLTELGVPADVLLRPPVVVPTYLADDNVTPCPSATLLRRDVVVRVGGFEGSFRDLFEDIVCWVKIGLEAPVIAKDTCWSYYRQHEQSSCAIASRAGSWDDSNPDRRRKAYLEWVAAYLARKGVTDRGVWRALNDQLWSYRYPLLSRSTRVLRGRVLLLAGRMVEIAKKRLEALVSHVCRRLDARGNS